MKRQDIWNRLGKRKRITWLNPYKSYTRRTNLFPPPSRNQFSPLKISPETFNHSGALSVGSMSTQKNIPVFVDYAPTSKGKCFQCRVRIIKGTPRGWYYDKMGLKGGKVPTNKKWVSGNMMTVKRLLCFKCIIYHMSMMKNTYKKHVREYSKNLKKLKRMGKMKKASRALDTQRIMNALGEPATSD